MAEFTPERIERAKLFLSRVSVESPDALRARLEETRRNWFGELDGLSAAQQDFKPAPDKWSIREVNLHMTHAMDRVSGLIALLASGTTPQAPTPRMGVVPDDPGAWEKVEQGIRAAFESAKATMTALEGAPNLDTRFPHPIFGPLNCRDWAAFHVLHANVHVDQMKRNKKDDSFPN